MPLKPRLISLWSNLFRRDKVENELGREVDACLDIDGCLIDCLLSSGQTGNAHRSHGGSEIRMTGIRAR